MKSNVPGLMTLAGAAALVVGITVAQGYLTDRWKDKSVSKDLAAAAKLLEAEFPRKFGNWELERDLEGDPKELERAGAVGHVSRLYRNVRTKSRVSAFVVCATPHDASGHTPDRCYPSAGFEIAEQEHREVIQLGDGATAEAFSGSFKKPGESLRIMWTYAATGKWMAPQIARIELANFPAVYKLYAIVNETGLPRGEGTRIGLQFLSDLIPEFDRAIFADTASTAASEGGSASRGASGGTDS